MSPNKQLFMLGVSTLLLAGLIGVVLWGFLKGGILPQHVSESISSLLEQGQFHAALEGLDELDAGDADRLRLERLMKGRAMPAIRFQFQKQGEPPSPLLDLRDPEIENLVLTNQDNYRIQIQLPAAGPANYLYLFQIDHDGKLHRLFPNPIYSDITNPVLPGLTVQLPQSESDWLFYMVTPASGNPGPVSETICLVASPWQARDLDRYFDKEAHEYLKLAPEDLVASFMERIRLREMAGIGAVYVERFVFRHAGR